MHQAESSKDLFPQVKEFSFGSQKGNENMSMGKVMVADEAHRNFQLQAN